MMHRIQFIAVGLIALTFLSPLAFAKEKNTTPGRLLTGKVLDQGDNPVVNAVVYVADTRTHAVKTYIVGDGGTYRFPALAANVDYEVHAEFNGKSSDTKRVSQFDDRKVVTLDLKIITK